MNRKELLKELVENKKPAEIIVTELGKYSWDSEVEYVTLKTGDISRVLSCYLEGKITEADVEQWANAIESREDIAYEKSNEGFIKDLIFELANPDLTEKLSKKRAEQICLDLVERDILV